MLYSTLKGQIRVELGKRRPLHCGQPLSVDLDHRVSGGHEKQWQMGECRSQTIFRHAGNGL